MGRGIVFLVVLVCEISVVDVMCLCFWFFLLFLKVLFVFVGEGGDLFIDVFVFFKEFKFGKDVCILGVWKNFCFEFLVFFLWLLDDFLLELFVVFLFIFLLWDIIIGGNFVICFKWFLVGSFDMGFFFFIVFLCLCRFDLSFCNFLLEKVGFVVFFFCLIFLFVVFLDFVVFVDFKDGRGIILLLIEFWFVVWVFFFKNFFMVFDELIVFFVVIVFCFSVEDFGICGIVLIFFFDDLFLLCFGWFINFLVKEVVNFDLLNMFFYLVFFLSFRFLKFFKVFIFLK